MVGFHLKPNVIRLCLNSVFPREHFAACREAGLMRSETGDGGLMWRRRSRILVLSGILCLQTFAFADDPSSLLNKGREAFQSGDLNSAEHYSRLALDESERTGNAVQRAEALGDLGGVLLARGRHAEAKSFCLEALEVLRHSPSKRYLPVVLNNLGAISSENEEFVQAESYLTEALRVIKELNPRDPYSARVL